MKDLLYQLQDHNREIKQVFYIINKNRKDLNHIFLEMMMNVCKQKKRFLFQSEEFLNFLLRFWMPQD
jgi:hypothetical protein